MSSAFPGGLDNFTNPTASDSLDSATVPHAAQHANANDAIEAIESTLGTNPQGASATVKARLDTLDTTVASKETPAGAQAKADAAQANATAVANTKVASVSAGDTTVTVAGTPTAPTVKVNPANLTIASSQISDKGSANGVASLDSSGKVPSTQLPSTTIANTYVVASQAAMLALSAEVGDIAIRTDQSKTYILQATPASTLANWTEILTPTSGAITVNGTTINLGQSGTVTADANTLTNTTLASNVVNSSLTKIGLATSGVVKSTTGTLSTGTVDDTQLTSGVTDQGDANKIVKVSNTGTTRLQSLRVANSPGYGTVEAQYALSINPLASNPSLLLHNGIATNYLPSTSGTLIGTGDSKTVTTSMIADNAITHVQIAAGTIIDSDINASAAITASKISGTAAVLNPSGGAVQTVSGGMQIKTLADATRGLQVARNSATQSVDIFQVTNSDYTTRLFGVGPRGQVTLAVDSTTVVPLTINQFSGNSNNLTEWYNSTPTLRAKIDSNGAFYSGGIISAGSTGTVPITTQMISYPSTSTTVGFYVRAQSGQTSDLLRVGDFSNNALAGFNAVGQSYTGSTSTITSAVGGAATGTSSGTTATITTTSNHNLSSGDLVTLASFTPTGYNGTYVCTVTGATTFTVTTSGSNLGAGTGGTVSVPAQASITARSAGTVGLLIKSAANNGATDLFTVQDSSGNKIAGIRYFGAINAGTQIGGTQLSAFSVNATTIGTIVRGANSQTADLLQVQNNGGTSKFAIVSDFNRSTSTTGYGVWAFIGNSTAPTAADTTAYPNGGFLYVESGALKYRGSGGTTTTIAVA